MAAPPNSGMPGTQPSPQQIAAMQAQIAQEAQKRGMTPQQFQAWQRQQIEADAKKAGMTVEQYINNLKQQAIANHQRQQQMAQQQVAAQQSGQPQVQGQTGQQVPITPGPPDPKSTAVAKWLRGQDLKSRTCILNGQRKDMFKGMPPPQLPYSPTHPTKNQPTDPLIPTQSNVLSAPSNHPPTPRPAKRTPSSPP